MYILQWSKLLKLRNVSIRHHREEIKSRRMI